MPLAYGLGLCGCDAGALLLSTCLSARAAPHFLASRLTASQLPLVLTEDGGQSLEALAPLVEMREPNVDLVIAERWEVHLDRLRHRAQIISTLLFVIKNPASRQ